MQISVLNSEKEVLEEAAATANLKVQETREAMAAQAKQLGQLQYLPPRLQDMQEQVQACTGHATLERLDSTCLAHCKLQTSFKGRSISFANSWHASLHMCLFSCVSIIAAEQHLLTLVLGRDSLCIRTGSTCATH